MDSCLSVLCWCFVGGGTPVLIPNTAVKPSRSDGSRKGRVARRQQKVLKNGGASRKGRASVHCKLFAVHYSHVLGITPSNVLYSRYRPLFHGDCRNSCRYFSLQTADLF